MELRSLLQNVKMTTILATLSLICCPWNIVLNGYVDSEISSAVQFDSDFSRYPLREKDGLTFEKNYARTNTFKFSFFNRIVDMWNSLPFSIRSVSSISSFKRGVRNLLMNNS